MTTDSVGREVDIEVNDNRNISEVSLRFTEDGRGRIHFKSNVLE